MNGFYAPTYKTDIIEAWNELEEANQTLEDGRIDNLKNRVEKAMKLLSKFVPENYGETR